MYLSRYLCERTYTISLGFDYLCVEEKNTLWRMPENISTDLTPLNFFENYCRTSMTGTWFIHRIMLFWSKCVWFSWWQYILCVLGVLKVNWNPPYSHVLCLKCTCSLLCLDDLGWGQFIGLVFHYRTARTDNNTPCIEVERRDSRWLQKKTCWHCPETWDQIFA